MLTLDGMNPDELTPDRMPNLTLLRAQGTWWEEARAVFPAETLPNHAAMATGLLPKDNGILANNWATPPVVVRDYMQSPSLLQADTIVTRLERACDSAGGINTATVMSKTYLEGLFDGEAASGDDPFPQRRADYHPFHPAKVPVSDHALDANTMANFRDWISTQPAGTPQFGWINLGDIDRAGHADQLAPLSGGSVTSLREAALRDTDAEIGLLVNELEQSGAWDNTVLLINSDHRMDWGTQEKRVDAASALVDAGYATTWSGDFVAITGGGTSLLWVTRDSLINPMARLVDELPGVEFVVTERQVPGLGNPTQADMGFDHPRAPQIQAFMEPGWHSDEFNGATAPNQLPGNHGHPITQKNVLLVAGGHPALRDLPLSVPGEKVYDPGRRLFSQPAQGPGTLSVAPTIAALFGIGEPASGYARPPLTEAFDPGALSSGGVCGGGPADSLPLGPTPRCLDLYLEVGRSKAKTIALSCSDSDGDHPVYTIVDEPRHGSLTRPDAESGTAIYEPDKGYVGDDSFTYRARDDDGLSNIARVDLHVTPPTPQPDADPSCPGSVSKIVRGTGSDRVLGSPGSDSIRLGPGRDRGRGLDGDDCIVAGTGPDRLSGGEGLDLLSGGAGADKIVGGPDLDRGLLGGPGRDTIDARDDVSTLPPDEEPEAPLTEPIDCGAGRDTVLVDRLDRPADNCERVKRSSRR